jgi:hypothetical protein
MVMLIYNFWRRATECFFEEQSDVVLGALSGFDPSLFQGTLRFDQLWRRHGPILGRSSCHLHELRLVTNDLTGRIKRQTGAATRGPFSEIPCSDPRSFRIKRSVSVPKRQ